MAHRAAQINREHASSAAYNDDALGLRVAGAKILFPHFEYTLVKDSLCLFLAEIDYLKYWSDPLGWTRPDPWCRRWRLPRPATQVNRIRHQILKASHWRSPKAKERTAELFWP